MGKGFWGPSWNPPARVSRSPNSSQSFEEGSATSQLKEPPTDWKFLENVSNLTPFPSLPDSSWTLRFQPQSPSTEPLTSTPTSVQSGYVLDMIICRDELQRPQSGFLLTAAHLYFSQIQAQALLRWQPCLICHWEDLDHLQMPAVNLFTPHQIPVH